MRFLLMMAALLIVSYLVFKGYEPGLDNIKDNHVGGDQIDPLKKARDVNQIIQDAAQIQRQVLEKQSQ